MKRILLPTDFSDNAYNAIRYAMQFFRNEKCTFYFLHTFTPVSYNVGYLIENPMPYGLEEIARMNSEKEIELIETKIKEEFNNSKHSFERISAFNMLVNEIKDTVERYDIDLIVMGTKGTTGAKEIFIGTHTMYTIKNVKCPVLAVPSGFDFEEPKEILFPTDYNLSSTNKYLPFIKNICDNHTSRLHLLNAYYGIPLDKDQEKIKDFVDNYFKNNAHIFHIADGMDVIEAIEDFQKMNIINMLVMVHNKHSFFENLLFKPVINQIAHHTNIPFLVIPSEKRIGSNKKSEHIDINRKEKENEDIIA
ncbi:Nucleotide-binding universal stress protein, UspA family [Aquimarina amphilecti]|uniref:Nucleotide-binding universal stress protein, UspA family n=1 Tax=Aquimarina amphilecti TaxID=1038014 RepID=A0A1H7MFJ4_AQUAM|nr:universal stress protein [Aquimarina amphilecti]SEL09678.1 Nucleotide-binding universal stress protein, UspA family [Aquimarina amphilecti]